MCSVFVRKGITVMALLICDVPSWAGFFLSSEPTSQDVLGEAWGTGGGVLRFRIEPTLEVFLTSRKFHGSGLGAWTWVSEPRPGPGTKHGVGGDNGCQHGAFFTGRERHAARPWGLSSSCQASSRGKDGGGEEAMVFISELLRDI